MLEAFEVPIARKSCDTDGAFDVTVGRYELMPMPKQLAYASPTADWPDAPSRRRSGLAAESAGFTVTIRPAPMRMERRVGRNSN